jgi:hypothetical protein
MNFEAAVEQKANLFEVHLNKLAGSERKINT